VSSTPEGAPRARSPRARHSSRRAAAAVVSKDLPHRRFRALAPATDPVLMTTRARILVLIVAFRNFTLGAAILAMQDRFTSNSYDVIRSVPWPLWGWSMIVVGVLCTAAALSMDELTARVGVGLSATVSLVWAVGFTCATFGEFHASPAGPIVWASLTAKDFLICSYPMASPFEPIIRRALIALVPGLRADGGAGGDLS
jgi:hypothetical protein